MQKLKQAVDFAIRNQLLLEQSWGTLTLDRGSKDLAAVGLHCHDLGQYSPVRSVRKRLIRTFQTESSVFEKNLDNRLVTFCL